MPETIVQQTMRREDALARALELVAEMRALLKKAKPTPKPKPPKVLTFDQMVALLLYGTSESGNYGHAGRPGQVGGSAPSGAPTKATLLKSTDDVDLPALAQAGDPSGRTMARRLLFNPRTEEVIVGGATGVEGRDQSHAEAHALAVGDTVAPPFRAAHHDQFAVHGHLQADTPNGGLKGTKFERGPLSIQIDRVIGEDRVAQLDAVHDFLAWATRHGATKDTKVWSIVPGMVHMGEKLGKVAPELFKKRRVPIAATYRDKLALLLYGTSESGNYGHAGRPGQVGGSAPSGLTEQIARYTHGGARATGEVIGASRRLITGEHDPTPNYTAAERAQLWGDKTDAEIEEALVPSRAAQREKDEKVRVLVDAVRDAAPNDTPLFRAIYVSKNSNGQRKFDALKAGDQFSMDQLSSFSGDRDTAGKFAMTPESIDAGITDPDRMMHPSDAKDYINYEFKIEGEHRSLDVSKTSKYSERERLTFGTFEVVKIEDNTEVPARTLAESKVPYRRTITLRQVSTNVKKKKGAPTIPPLPVAKLTRDQMSALLLYGTEKSGNYGHAGRPGQIGGSAPSGTYPSKDTVQNWGHKAHTLADTGDETALSRPVAGKPFIVYRLGREGGGLDNKNAGNADGVAAHLANIDDYERPAFKGGSGDTITAYEVVIDDDFATYQAQTEGRAAYGKKEEPSTKVGRTANVYSHDPKYPHRKGGTVAYSFPKGGKWKAKVVTTVPLAEMREALRKATGSDSFDSAGTITGADIIRRVFAKRSTKSLSALLLYGTEKSGNYGHAGRPGEVGGSAPSGGGGVKWQEGPQDLKDVAWLRRGTKGDGGKLSVRAVGVSPSLIETVLKDHDPSEWAGSLFQSVPGDVQITMTRGVVSKGHPAITLTANRRDGLNAMVTYFRTPEGDLNVHMDSVEVPRETQAHDIAKGIMEDQHKMNQTLGVKRTDLYADIDVGGYAWAKYGFKARQPRQAAQRFDNELRKRADQWTHEQQAVLRVVIERYRNDPKLPWHLAGTVTRGGRQIGKELMLGSGWEAVLDMDDKEATTRLEHYVRSKK